MKLKYDPHRTGKLRYVFIAISIITALLFLVPFYWMIINSLLPNSALIQVPPPIFPKNPIFENYLYVFRGYPVAMWLFNSLWVSAVTSVIGVYFAALAAYPLAKKRFPGSIFLFWLPIAFMTVPRAAIMLPLFITMLDLKLVNTYFALILPLLAAPFGVFLMKQMMTTVPDEILDAAKIDGCSEFRPFHTMVLPIVKPGLGALLIFLFVASWNDFLWQLIVITDPLKKTVPLGLVTFAKEFYIEYGYLMAAATAAALPIIIFFMFFQRYFVSGLTMGSLKE